MTAVHTPGAKWPEREALCTLLPFWGVMTLLPLSFMDESEDCQSESYGLPVLACVEWLVSLSSLGSGGGVWKFQLLFINTSFCVSVWNVSGWTGPERTRLICSNGCRPRAASGLSGFWSACQSGFFGGSREPGWKRRKKASCMKQETCIPDSHACRKGKSARIIPNASGHAAKLSDLKARMPGKESNVPKFFFKPPV